jgi:riboflavin synthase
VFTGIVAARGRIERVAARPGADGLLRLVVRPETDLGALVPGESVAVDGVCLTVALFEEGAPAFDVVPETLRRTTLGARRAGDRVNLERALRAGDALGGHWVQGHVEGVGTVGAVERRGDEVRLVVRLPDPLAGAVVPKGSVAIDGVSLTVGEVWAETGDGPGGRFSVYLVPHTLSVTGLSEKRSGDPVNVEPDLLGRWVEHHLRRILAERGPS